jgi:hypothetical protein
MGEECRALLTTALVMAMYLTPLFNPEWRATLFSHGSTLFSYPQAVSPDRHGGQQGDGPVREKGAAMGEECRAPFRIKVPYTAV